LSRARVLALALAATLLTACHLNPFHFWHYANASCHRPQEYQRAVQVAPLKVPAGLDVPNTQGALAIPSTDEAPPPPSAKEPCLDEPPKWKAAPPPRGLSG